MGTLAYPEIGELIPQSALVDHLQHTQCPGRRGIAVLTEEALSLANKDIFFLFWRHQLEMIIIYSSPTSCRKDDTLQIGIQNFRADAP